MLKYRLTEEAKEDLIKIANYGDEHYGMAKSDIYRDEFKQHFKELAKFPLHYQAVEHIRKGYRRRICGVHSVYYRLDETKIVIVRVLGRQDPFGALS